MSGIHEVRKMCEDLRNELREFTEGSESRRAQRLAEPGVTIQEVGEVCRHMWNSRAQELEQRIRYEVAQETRAYLPRREWTEGIVGFVPWSVFTEEGRVLRSLCDGIEAKVTA